MKKYDMINKSKLTFAAVSLISLSAIFFSGCWWKSESKKEETGSNLMVINVLDKNYFEDCHITGSVNIPFDELDDKLKDMDKKKQYVVYCSNYACIAAPHTAKTMKDAGFEDVMVYHGGIVEWHQKGYPCTGPAEMSYLKEENEPLEEEQDGDEMDSVTAEELKNKMMDSGLLS